MISQSDAGMRTKVVRVQETRWKIGISLLLKSTSLFTYWVFSFLFWCRIIQSAMTTFRTTFGLAFSLSFRLFSATFICMLFSVLSRRSCPITATAGGCGRWMWLHGLAVWWLASWQINTHIWLCTRTSRCQVYNIAEFFLWEGLVITSIVRITFYRQACQNWKLFRSVIISDIFSFPEFLYELTKLFSIIRCNTRDSFSKRTLVCLVSRINICTYVA